MMTEPIKAIRAENFPSRERRQHSQFEVGGTGRNETPVPKVRFVFRYDLLRDMGVLDDGQCRYADMFVTRNMAALRVCEARISQIYGGDGRGVIMDAISYEDKTLADQYHELIRKLNRNPFELVLLSCLALGSREDLNALRGALMKIAPHIEKAFTELQTAIDEILACKED